MFNRSWYKSIFSPAPKESICFDITPEYCGIGDEGIRFFKEFLPKTQIIYLIRHPYDRLVSQIKMNMSRRLNQDPDFCDWRELLNVPALAKRGDYMNQVPQWDAHFSDDRLIDLPFGRIKTDPKVLLQQIEDHCNLPRFDYPAPSKVYHKSPPVQVPQEVLKILEDRAAPQADFIKTRFGADFLEQSR